MNFELTASRALRVEDRIRDSVELLTSSQRKVAEYILAGPQDAAFLSSTELGSRVGVSEATVIRLALRLGFEGYPQLQRELRVQVRRMLAPAEVLDRLSEAPEDNVFAGVFRQDIENLVATAENISYAALHETVRAMLDARWIYVLGLRRAYPLAYTCAFLLNQSLQKATLLDLQGGALPEQLLHLGREDLLITVSFPRYAAYTMKVLRYAKQVGCRTVTITDSELSPFARQSDITLAARCYMPSPFVSNAAGTTIVAALAAAVSVQQRKQARETLAQLDRITRELDLHLAE